MTSQSVFHQQLMQQLINRTFERKRILDLHWLSGVARENIKVIVQDLYKAYVINSTCYVSVIEFMEAWLQQVKQNPQFQQEDALRLENMLYKLKHLISVPTLLHHELSYIPVSESMASLWQSRTSNIQSQFDISMVWEFMLPQEK